LTFLFFLSSFFLLSSRHIFESDSICEYLEQLYPGPIFRSFLPADPYLRAKTRMLTRINDLYLQPEYFQTLFKGEKAKADPARLKLSLEVCNKQFDAIETLLAEVFVEPNSYNLPSAGPFICGKKVTLGDAALGTSLVLALKYFPIFEYDPFVNRPRLLAWWEALLKDQEFLVIKKEMEDALVERLARVAKQQALKKAKL